MTRILWVRNYSNQSHHHKKDIREHNNETYTTSTMEEFKNAGLEEYFENAYGYAAFPKVGKFAFIVGVGGAGGDVYVKDKGKVGTSKLMMASGGWSLGLTVYSEVIFFEDEDAFNKFTSGNFEFQAGAKAHILHVGADSAARTTGSGETTGAAGGAGTKGGYTNGMATFVMPKGGAMLDVSCEGQKFSYKADA